MTAQQARQVELVCAEVAKALAELCETPAPAVRGQQVVVHVSKDRRQFWVERPPAMVVIRE
jgi:hypothetical protein